MRCHRTLCKLNRCIYYNNYINRSLARFGRNIEQLPQNPLKCANDDIASTLAKVAIFKALCK